jgi:hypothetical protein
MVDPKSWTRHSQGGPHHVSQRRMTSELWLKYDYDEYLGCGCECAACDQVVDKLDPILPIRDFQYTGRDGSNGILNDDFYFLCSPVVRGYALKERKWGTYDIGNPLFTFNNH